MLLGNCQFNSIAGMLRGNIAPQTFGHEFWALEIVQTKDRKIKMVWLHRPAGE
jgi:hypothetical protein